MAHVLTIGNGKGGVGKTSVVANLAGVAAVNGWRVLAVDLDVQGNLGSDLGYKQTGLSDNGQALLDALSSRSAPVPLREVRPSLDVVPGGRRLTEVQALISARQASDPHSIGDLALALAAVAPAYDLIIIDTPPAGGIVVDAALAASDSLVIPVKADDGSLDGLELMAAQFAAVRGLANPRLRLLGVILFDFSSAGTRLRAQVREQLGADLGGIAPLFRSVIRKSERGAFDMRQRGVLAHEYHRLGLEHDKRTSIAERIRGSRDGAHLHSYSSASGGLAEDYAHLTTELLDAIGGQVASGDPWR